MNSTGVAKVSLNQNCGSGGWRTSLPIGAFARFNKGICDDDTQMCEQTCGMEDNQLGSMDIPEGLAVKLWDGPAFTGASITYYGPRNIDCLNWEGWQNRASSIQVAPTETLTPMRLVSGCRCWEKDTRNAVTMAMR